jgi:hypothetical protein
MVMQRVQNLLKMQDFWEVMPCRWVVTLQKNLNLDKH